MTQGPFHKAILGLVDHPGLLFRWLVQGLLALAAVTFVIQWLLPRWRKIFRIQSVQTQSGTDSRRGSNSTADVGKARMRERLQQEHASKASSFMERILIPREEAKRKQKEEEFEKFLGPAWKGKGQLLGGDEVEDVDGPDKESSVSHHAARRRKPLSTVESKTQPPKNTEPSKKHVIQLPEEPPEGGPTTVVVRLRTPVGRICQRRFLHTHTVQIIMEYMTTLGFKQSHYTISTSYPRRNLSEYLNKTMWEMDFKGQVTLNVEEKELD